MQTMGTYPREDMCYRAGVDVTRQDTSGNTDVLTKDGWRTCALPEANFPRQTIWHVSRQESGIKAWRYGFQSEENYRNIDPLSPVVEADPEELGHLEGYRREWRFTPVGRPSIAAYGYHLTSKGLALNPTPSAFTYYTSNNLHATLLPEDWELARHQKGDIESSRLLILKNSMPKGFEPGRHQIGFFDLDKNRTRPALLEMTFIPNSEEAQFGKCFFLHGMPRGPTTITLEDRIKQVVVSNIKTDDKRVAFQRDAGTSRLKAEQTNTGRIAVDATVDFSDEKIYDAEDFLYSGHKSPPVTQR